MKRIRFFVIILLFSKSIFSETIIGPQDACAGVIYSYQLAGGNCWYTWDLIGGEFTDLANSSSTQQNGSTALNVRWTSAGTKTITITSQYPCPYSSVYLNVNVNDFNLSITASSSSVVSGNSVELNANGGGGSILWSCNSSPCNLNSTTWSTVTASPTSTKIYTVTSNVGFGNISCTKTASKTITVTAAPISGNSISSDQASCSSFDPVALVQQSGTSLSGGSGSYTHKWQSSINNGITWTDISAATANTYNPPVLTQTTRYRRVVTSGSLTSISNSLTMKIMPASLNLTTATYTRDTIIKTTQFINVTGNISTINNANLNIRAGEYIDINQESDLNDKVTIEIEACINGMRRGDMEEVENDETVSAIELINTDFKTASFPNPISSGELNFGRMVTNYSLLNSRGAQVRKGGYVDKLDVSGLDAGLYLLKLDDQVEKIIVQ